jgi:hypothetical protein
VDQDEAFTIGFTAGASKNTLAEVEKDVYKTALQSYDEPFAIKGKDLLAFDPGAKAGKLSPCTNIHLIDVPELRDRKLGELRPELGSDIDILLDLYEMERQIIPNTPASIRLPINDRKQAREAGNMYRSDMCAVE